MTDLNAILTPGMLVRHPAFPDWGVGQVQSNIGGRITVNFREQGKVVIDGNRIGGYTELKEHFGYRVLGEDDTSYAPVIAIFASTALMALAIVLNLHQGLPVLTWLKWFIATSMVVLAIQKLQDVEGFVNGFLGYDLLARAHVPYGYAYPFLELYTGVGMLALIGTGNPLIWMVAPVGIFIGAIGGWSVFKAVYIDKRELKCACVGGDSNVPLGFVSLTENLMMIGMAVWMIFKPMGLGH